MSTEHTLFWKCFQLVAQILTKLFFNLKVEGRRNIPGHGGVLIVSNHQSNLDPALLGAFLQRPLNFIAKSELFGNPFGAWLLRRLNAFPLRQGKGDVGALKETIHRLREGHVLNIFPEGQRSSDGQIGTLQKGVALIIRRANVPVIPAIIVGAFDAWPMHRRMWRMAQVRVKFGPPMKLDELHSDEEIAAAIDRKLRGMFQEMQQHTRQSIKFRNGVRLTRVSSFNPARSYDRISTTLLRSNYGSDPIPQQSAAIRRAINSTSGKWAFTNDAQ